MSKQYRVLSDKADCGWPPIQFAGIGEFKFSVTGIHSDSGAANPTYRSRTGEVDVDASCLAYGDGKECVVCTGIEEGIDRLRSRWAMNKNWNYRTMDEQQWSTADKLHTVRPIGKPHSPPAKAASDGGTFSITGDVTPIALAFCFASS